MLGDLRENKLIMVGRETERRERGERNGVCERRKGRTIKIQIQKEAFNCKLSPLYYEKCAGRNQ